MIAFFHHVNETKTGFSGRSVLVNPWQDGTSASSRPVEARRSFLASRDLAFSAFDVVFPGAADVLSIVHCLPDSISVASTPSSSPRADFLSSLCLS